MEDKKVGLELDSYQDSEHQAVTDHKLTSQLELSNDKYPKSIFFIVAYEACERFSYYGTKILLNQYMKSALGLKQEIAKSQVHLFNGILYAFPLVGAAISDSFLGKFYTILLFNIIGLIGNSLLSVSSINNLLAPFGHYPFWSYILPAILVAIGTGGIKPCVSAHGSDQFLGSQSHLLDKFYSMFYVSMNVGKLGSQFTTPVLKDKITCFGSECYLLAFGTPTILLFISVLLILSGYRYYRIVPPQRQFLPLKAAKLTFLALIRRWKATPTERREKTHWLEFSKPEFDDSFIRETRLLGRVAVMTIPNIFFWALYDQNNTEWQNQYERMNKNVLGFIPIPTEASSNVNSILVIFMVPLLSYYVYPWLERRKVRISLISRMTLGFFFLILSFVISTLLNYVIDQHTTNITYKNNVVSSCVGCLNGAWQLPQYFLLSLGESLFYPTSDQFAYTQVGPQMKATSSSLMIFSMAMGNYFVFFMEFPLSHIESATNRQWIYIVVSSCFLGLLVYLGNHWFIAKESEEFQLESESEVNKLSK